jgi:hypothetical protein
MDTEKVTDYEKALQLVNTVPRFYLGQEVKTKEGKGIIICLRMQWNGLYIEPNTSEAVVWYSTESAVNSIDGGKWVSLTYRLTELTSLE